MISLPERFLEDVKIILEDEYEQFIKRKFYWGDFSATPCEWETIKYTAGGNYLYAKRPIWYKDVKCNLIDMGY